MGRSSGRVRYCCITLLTKGGVASRRLGPYFHTEDCGLVFPRNGPLLRQVKDALLAIRRDGTYQQLYDEFEAPINTIWLEKPFISETLLETLVTLSKRAPRRTTEGFWRSGVDYAASCRMPSQILSASKTRAQRLTARQPNQEPPAKLVV